MKTKIIFLSLMVCFILAGCGYTISGRGKLFPDNIKTVFIPEFDNVTTTPPATTLITTAVTDKFVRRSGLKRVNSRSLANSMLEGKIIGFQVSSPIAEENEGTRTLTIKILLELRFIDLTKNSAIYENQRFNFSHRYEFNTEDFFDQDKDSQEKIADKLAANVVTAILENF